MGWKEPLLGLAALVALWILIRAFRGLWAPKRPTEKDSADLWLHADPGRKPNRDDGPVVDDTSEDGGEADGGDGGDGGDGD